MIRPDTEYFHFISDLRGDRYFRVNWHRKRVVMVVADPGTAKKGRPHCSGIHTIAMSSFLGTYYWFYGKKYGATNLLATSQHQFDKAFDTEINNLKMT